MLRKECPYRPYCLLHKTPDGDVTKRQRSAALRMFHPPKNDFRFPTKIRLTKVMCLLYKHLCYMSNTSHVVQSKLCKKIYIKQQQQQQQKQTTTKEENKEKTTTHKQNNTSPRKLKKHKHKERNKEKTFNTLT